MGGFTRLLHSGKPDDLMDEVGGWGVCAGVGWGWVRGEGVYPLLCGGLYSPWGLSNTGKYVCVVYGYAFIYATIVHYALLPKAGIFLKGQCCEI